MILEYQFPLRYKLSLVFLISFRNTGEVDLFNLQDPLKKINFDSNYIKTQSLTLPEKIPGNHNM